MLDLQPGSGAARRAGAGRRRRSVLGEAEMKWLRVSDVVIMLLGVALILSLATIF